MNTEQPNITDGAPALPSQAFVKEAYHAPHLKIHGKLERMTLQDTSPGGGGGGGGGTGNTPVEE